MEGVTRHPGGGGEHGGGGVKLYPENEEARMGDGRVDGVTRYPGWGGVQGGGM